MAGNPLEQLQEFRAAQLRANLDRAKSLVAAQSSLPSQAPEVPFSEKVATNLAAIQTRLAPPPPPPPPPVAIITATEQAALQAKEAKQQALTGVFGAVSKIIATGIRIDNDGPRLAVQAVEHDLLALADSFPANHSICRAWLENRFPSEKEIMPVAAWPDTLQHNLLRQVLPDATAINDQLPPGLSRLIQVGLGLNRQFGDDGIMILDDGTVVGDFVFFNQHPNLKVRTIATKPGEAPVMAPYFEIPGSPPASVSPKASLAQLVRQKRANTALASAAINFAGSDAEIEMDLIVRRNSTGSVKLSPEESAWGGDTTRSVPIVERFSNPLVANGGSFLLSDLFRFGLNRAAGSLARTVPDGYPGSVFIETGIPRNAQVANQPWYARSDLWRAETVEDLKVTISGFCGINDPVTTKFFGITEPRSAEDFHAHLGTRWAQIIHANSLRLQTATVGAIDAAHAGGVSLEAAALYACWPSHAANLLALRLNQANQPFPDSGKRSSHDGKSNLWETFEDIEADLSWQ